MNEPEGSGAERFERGQRRKEMMESAKDMGDAMLDPTNKLGDLMRGQQALQRAEHKLSVRRTKALERIAEAVEQLVRRGA